MIPICFQEVKENQSLWNLYNIAATTVPMAPISIACSYTCCRWLRSSSQSKSAIAHPIASVSDPAASSTSKAFPIQSSQSSSHPVVSHHTATNNRHRHPHHRPIRPIPIILSTHLPLRAPIPDRIIPIIQHHPNRVPIVLAFLVAVRTAAHRRLEVVRRAVPGACGFELVDPRAVEAHVGAAGLGYCEPFVAAGGGAEAGGVAHCFLSFFW